MALAHASETAVPSPELVDVVLKALERSSEPLTARQLAGKLTGPFRQPPEVLSTVLEQLAEEGRLHRLPPFRGMTRYWTRDLDSFARSRVLESLARSKRPKTRSELRPPAGLSPDRWRKAIARLVETGEVRELPPLLGSRTKRLSVRPADPADYIAAALENLGGKLASTGVTENEVWEAARRLVEERLQQRQKDLLPELILERMPVVEPAAQSGALVSVRDLRRSLEFQEVNHDAFDRAVLQLGRQGRIALHRHDYVSSLTSAERDELVTDGQGNYYVGIALRTERGGPA